MIPSQLGCLSLSTSPQFPPFILQKFRAQPHSLIFSRGKMSSHLGLGLCFLICVSVPLSLGQQTTDPMVNETDTEADNVTESNSDNSSERVLVLPEHFATDPPPHGSQINDFIWDKYNYRTISFFFQIQMLD